MKADRDASQESSSDNVNAGARAPETPAAEGPRNSNNEGYSGLDLWLHRLTVMMLVFVCAVVGVLLIIFPWRLEWTDNRLLSTHPGLRAVVTSGFVRGVCSGLGLLDIWIGFWEALHYHEGKKPEHKS